MHRNPSFILHAAMRWVAGIRPGMCMLQRGVGAGFAQALLLAAAWAAVDEDRMQRAMSSRFGSRGVRSYQAWRELIAEVKSESDSDRLAHVNEFFDRRIRFTTDAENWRQEDYWATPIETLGKGAGDCEDYVIAKYFTLIEAGMDRTRLRWFYVMATLNNGGRQSTEAHMVLGYYASPSADPLILDSLTSVILPASRRPDLVPVFSFNSDGIWRQGAAGPTGTVNQLSMWRELMRKMKEEGYEP